MFGAYRITVGLLEEFRLEGGSGFRGAGGPVEGVGPADVGALCAHELTERIGRQRRPPGVQVPRANSDRDTGVSSGSRRATARAVRLFPEYVKLALRVLGGFPGRLIPAYHSVAIRVWL